jgi:hypothetical protein
VELDLADAATIWRGKDTKVSAAAMLPVQALPRRAIGPSVVYCSQSGDNRSGGGEPMADISADLQQELDELQAAYKQAVDNWVAAIREEEALASGNHNVVELDKWEAAHFREHKLHKEVDYRKRLYENALRLEFFGF